MKNKQNGILKIAFLLGALAFSVAGRAQTSVYRLHTADSMFNKKLYTQSFEHYQAILENREYTPAMLLKMAYIQEGLDHVGRALYYINLYYIASNDPAALRKMEELAAKYNLHGYETTDVNRLLNGYYKYYSSITLAIAAVCVFLLALAFYTQFRLHKRPVAAFVINAVMLLALFAHLNFGKEVSVGIVMDPRTYFMDGPSAAADVVEIVDAGHRLEVVGKKDVWLKVKWKGATAYVKEDNVQPVKL